MSDLARSVGSTACHLIDGISQSVCATNDDVTAVGFSGVILFGVVILMFAVMRVDRTV